MRLIRGQRFSSKIILPFSVLGRRPDMYGMVSLSLAPRDNLSQRLAFWRKTRGARNSTQITGAQSASKAVERGSEPPRTVEPCSHQPRCRSLPCNPVLIGLIRKAAPTETVSSIFRNALFCVPNPQIRIQILSEILRAHIPYNVSSPAHAGGAAGCVGNGR